MNYKKKAWLVSDIGIAYGYKDKYGFHIENKITGDYLIGKVSRRDINKIIFYDFKKAIFSSKKKNLFLDGGNFIISIDAGFALTRMVLAPTNRPSKSTLLYQTNTLYDGTNIEALILEFFKHLGFINLYNVNVIYQIFDTKCGLIKGEISSINHTEEI